MKVTKIGIVGIGAISGIYLENLKSMYDNLEVVAICDLVREKAEKAQEQYNIPKLYDTMYELFEDDEIEIVLNLTRPYEHYGVTKAALEAGKHVYSEKPLAASLEEGIELVELARKQGRMLGGAPDTFLGAGLQTCRKLIDDGFIGEPVAASAHMLCHGHESWHPDPAFYYRYGGGPMMDMGPYYITALISLLGSVKSVHSVAKTTFPQRTITSQPLAGTVVDVEVPTHITGILNFASGVVGTIVTSFDVYYPTQAKLEIYGTKGTLILPDPNYFSGPIYLLRPEDGEMKEIPLCFDHSENSRGLGLSDMARALTESTDFRTSCKQTYHVLEILQKLQSCTGEGGVVPIESQYERPAPRCI